MVNVLADIKTLIQTVEEQEGYKRAVTQSKEVLEAARIVKDSNIEPTPMRPRRASFARNGSNHLQ